MVPGDDHGRVHPPRGWALRAASVAAMAATALIGCSTVDPYEVTCRELVTSPDKLRETSLKLADKDVQAKVRYEREMMRICESAPESYRPGQRVKPEG